MLYFHTVCVFMYPPVLLFPCDDLTSLNQAQGFSLCGKKRGILPQHIPLTVQSDKQTLVYSPEEMQLCNRSRLLYINSNQMTCGEPKKKKDFVNFVLNLPKTMKSFLLKKSFCSYQLIWLLQIIFCTFATNL